MSDGVGGRGNMSYGVTRGNMSDGVGREGEYE